MDAIDILVLLCYLGGLFFNLAGVVGIIRLPDIYCRLHSSSKNTTLGALLIAFGLAIRQFQAGEGPAGLKVLLIAVLVLVVTPIGSHALARAAYQNGAPLSELTVCDQYIESFREQTSSDV
ncbi:MAG: monovalent cation/H(+) antiporter subunit G [Chloroflexi bacterium]|nr:monovalent cation/H(+) antiporter subunit G [Chloroflexota bacterium]MCI0643730.1 monovalent cation/H(+) antiporter subunit G [Chloroflexota bacterium]